MSLSLGSFATSRELSLTDSELTLTLAIIGELKKCEHSFIVFHPSHSLMFCASRIELVSFAISKSSRRGNRRIKLSSSKSQSVRCVVRSDFVKLKYIREFDAASFIDRFPTKFKTYAVCGIYSNFFIRALYD